MEKPEIGDLVVLTSGSMRMVVEGVDGEQVACVWCHEGAIGRDAFDARLLKKWEHREEERPARSEALGQLARVDEDERRAVPGDEGRQTVVDRLPLLVRAHVLEW